MIIAAVITALGLIVGAWAATIRGYRLGGVVVVPLLAIYTLVNLASLPIFLLSTLVAFIGIDQFQQRWLIYGRRLFIMAVVIGMVLPVSIFLLLTVITGGATHISAFEFLGSILPGIAAYNLYREPPEDRIRDTVAAFGLFGALLVVGVGGLWLWVTPPCITCSFLPWPPANSVSLLLLGTSSDIAAVLGFRTVPFSQTVGTLSTITVVALIGLGLSEASRWRLGLRPVGVIALPLGVLFVLRAWWTIPLYLGAGFLVLMAVMLIHHWTLLYGRALLSLAAAIGVVTALAAMVVFGLMQPLLVFFTGLFAGIGAYSIHVSAPVERPYVVAINAGIFVLVFGMGRLLIEPLPTGIGTSVGIISEIGGLLCVVAAVVVWVYIERFRPSSQAINAAAVFQEENS